MTSLEPTFPVRWQTTTPGGRSLQVMVREQAINLLLDNDSPSVTFDPRGRLHGAFIEGRNYRRSLDNRMLCKWSELADGRSIRRRRWLSPNEARAVVDLVYGLAGQAAEQAAPAPPAVQTALKAVAAWNWRRLEADRQRFQSIYTPVGILPPDQYLALVLQATQGCSHNACTFCTFYRDIPFRIKTPDEFRSHIAGVLDFFGPALLMRRSIFLADANALVVPMPRLLALLDGLASSFIVPHSSLSLPLFAFIDAFHVERKSVADWQELGGRGLQRVYIGMESGHDPLLRWLNKPGNTADVLDAVQTLKRAGVAVSVIVMAGVGGAAFADAHLRDTVALLNAMPLGSGDLVYLSEFKEQPGSSYARNAAQDKVDALPLAAIRRQADAIRSGFTPRDPDRPPQFSRYDIDEFLY